MPDATFQDLVLDASDAHALGGFWASLLGRRLDTDDGPDTLVEAPEDGVAAERIWVDQVPEPRTGKTRAHLDLRLPAADVAPLVAAGATLVSEPHDAQHWWVLADPEGNLFCAMAPAPPEWGAPPVDRPTPFELVVDAADPAAIAAWWAGRLGGTVHERDGLAWIQGAVGFPWYAWVFNPVPEPKAVKNRLHWDLRLAGPDPAALVTAGARVLTEPHGDQEWWVLADPEGNEFCAFPPKRPGDHC